MVVVKGAADLGRCLEVRRGIFARPGLVLLAGLLAVAAWLALAAWMGSTIGKDASASIGIAAAIILPPGAIASSWGLSRVVFQIAVHENGIVRHDRIGRTVILWPEVAEVIEHVDVHESIFGRDERATFTFVARDGRRLDVDPDVPGFLELGKMASTLAQDCIASAYEVALMGRQRVRFGAVAVDGYGLHTSSGSMPWNAFAFVRLDRGAQGREPAWNIHTGAWTVVARIPTSDVANARIFVRMLERFGKLEVPAPTLLGDLDSLVAQAA